MTSKPNQFLDVNFVNIAKNQLNDLRERLQEIDESIDALQVERHVLTGKASALEQVLDLGMPEIEDLPEGTGEKTQTKTSSILTVHPRRSDRQNPLDLAEKILADRRGEPMHYRELAGMVFDQGGDLPEGSRGATLNALMNRDDRFIRPFRRGQYALKRDYPELKRSVGARRRRRSSAT